MTPGNERDLDLHTQTLKFRFLYVTDSTLNPIVGIVVTTSPICRPTLNVSPFELKIKKAMGGRVRAEVPQARREA